MNRAERIYKLHRQLKSRRAVPLKRLMDVLQASRATVVRDIGYMRDFMDAPIHYDRETNGYRYVDDDGEYELPGLWFNQSELYALLAVEQLLESVQPGLLAPSLGPLKARIRKLLEQTSHHSDTVTSRVLLQPVARRQVNDSIFGTVAGALLNNHQLDIDYHGREKGQRTRRRVHPARLMHYRDNWYLAAWCETAGDWRTFSLDRIQAATELEQATRPFDEAELKRYLGAAFGIFTGEASDWAVLRFSPRMSRWVADEQWHPDQIGQWQGERYELQIPYSDSRELMMDILKYGPDVDVLAPESLRNQVIERLRQALLRYKE